MMDRAAQQNLMMQSGMMAPSPQSLQMVPNSSQMNQQQSAQPPMNMNMMNMGMNMNFNGKNLNQKINKFLVFKKSDFMI